MARKTVVSALRSGNFQAVLEATAQALAVELDDAGNSATSKSMCAKSMIDVVRELRAVAPSQEAKDDLDDLAARREKRLARSAAAKAAPSA
jgi:hypothetical protein